MLIPGIESSNANRLFPLDNSSYMIGQGTANRGDIHAKAPELTTGESSLTIAAPP
jgi:hypothetical protein